MANLFKITKLLLMLGIFTYITRWYFHRKVNLEPYRKDGWFGRKALIKGGTTPLDDPTIKPFTVNISDIELTDLRRRLQKSRFTDHIAGSNFNYGFSSVVLKRIVKYWLSSEYNWRVEEAKLNSLPQFHTQIEGLQVHFVHVRPENASQSGTLPLLLIHSFPGSFYEFYKAIPYLVENSEAKNNEERVVRPSFEVVVPSIPGFTFSEGPHRKGFNATAAARVFLKLMKRLGHNRFIVHGGDIGNVIARTMAVLYPQNVLALHLVGNYDVLQVTNSAYQMLKTTFIAYLPRLFFLFETDYDREYSKILPLKEKLYHLFMESGYAHLQATKPDTLAASLVDSPVGLTAFILEKFASLSGHPRNANRKNGVLAKKFNLDELLTNVMLYWFSSGGIASTFRFWRENFVESTDLQNIFSQKVTVPTGTIDTPYALVRTPQKIVEKSYTKLVQYTNLPRGGHFATFEEPQLIVDDFQKFVNKLDLPLPLSPKKLKRIIALRDEM